MRHKLKPQALYRILRGEEEANVIREPHAAYLVSRQGKEEILPDSIAEGAGLGRSFIGSKLTLSTPTGKRTFSGLNPEDAKGAYESISSLMYPKLYDEIKPIVNYIRSEITRGYIRSSAIKQIIKQARVAKSKFTQAPEPGLVEDRIFNDFKFIEHIANLRNSQIERMRKDHINKHLDQFRYYFDTVEKNPLTEEQRIACITDEDNNLVIAGAGTGKTSTMVGRAGYLVRSGLAQPNEILLLAYGKKAADELRERIEERIGLDNIHVSTFHSLGLDIVAKASGKKPSISELIEGSGYENKKLQQFVDKRLAENCKQAKYRRLVSQYFAEYFYPPPDRSKFKNNGDHLRYLKDNEIVSLLGEEMKSYGEILVANFLFRNGVKYEYERNYEHDTRTPEHSQYRPDFFLTDYGIYIEYFGISKDGSTAPYVDREAYHNGMQWKRKTHTEYGTHLVEAFHYERIDRTLLKNLKKNLEELGVKLKPIPQKELLDHLRKGDKNGNSFMSKFVKLLTDLLLRIRETGLSRKKLEEKARKSAHPAMVQAAIKIVSPILEAYLDFLKKEECVDYDHMIQDARQHVISGEYTPKWKFILIDEFQDISKPRADLVKAIREHCEDCSIFAVGDDWQAIYRFTGSDVSFTTQFEKHFGASKLNYLNATFRFNDKLNQAASSFIQKNPNQLPKNLEALTTSAEAAVAVILQNNDPGTEDLSPILSHIEGQAETKAEVLILSRFSFYLPKRKELSTLSRMHPNLTLKTMTIHASKGKEADYVILVGAVSGTHGLPSEKITHPLLEALLPEKENFDHAEERRLLYVALTRAKHRAYIISNPARMSSFVEEIIDGEYNLDTQAFPLNTEDWLKYSTPCPECSGGMLRPQTQRATGEQFYGCTLYPRCRGSANACKACGLPMLGERYNRQCVDENCPSRRTSRR